MVDTPNKLAAGMEMVKVNRLMADVAQSIDHLYRSKRRRETRAQKQTGGQFALKLRTYLSAHAVADQCFCYAVGLAPGLSATKAKYSETGLKVVLDNTTNLHHNNHCPRRFEARRVDTSITLFEKWQ